MEEIKDIIEILSLADDEIKKNDENASAILDLQDLKSLKCLYNKYIEEKEKNKYLEENRLWSEATIEGLRRDFINKDNIRQKINFYKKVDNAVGVRILENLLEEYNNV